MLYVWLNINQWKVKIVPNSVLVGTTKKKKKWKRKKQDEQPLPKVNVNEVKETQNKELFTHDS